MATQESRKKRELRFEKRLIEIEEIVHEQHERHIRDQEALQASHQKEVNELRELIESQKMDNIRTQQALINATMAREKQLQAQEEELKQMKSALERAASALHNEGIQSLKESLVQNREAVKTEKEERMKSSFQAQVHLNKTIDDLRNELLLLNTSLSAEESESDEELQGTAPNNGEKNKEILDVSNMPDHSLPSSQVQISEVNRQQDWPFEHRDNDGSNLYGDEYDGSRIGDKVEVIARGPYHRMDRFNRPMFDGHTALDKMIASDQEIQLSTQRLVIWRGLQQFARGVNTSNFHAFPTTSTKRWVVKIFDRMDKGFPQIAEEMRILALCQAFALNFKALMPNKASISFPPIRFLMNERSNDFFLLEPYLGGSYVNYSDNCGFVNEMALQSAFGELAQAFSHYTFERSMGSLLVANLQGGGGQLLHPAVHTKDPRRFELSSTNLGVNGFRLFFTTHKCNKVCQALDLRSTDQKVVTGLSTLQPTAIFLYCVNQLCGSFVHPSSGNVHKGNGIWCDECWQRIQSTIVTMRCLGRRGRKKCFQNFEVSRFFYEAKGMQLPSRCPRHRI